jgi:hypothetical protein
MTLRKLAEVWHETLVEKVDEFKTKLASLGIPLIDGSLDGQGHTLVTCNLLDGVHDTLINQPNSIGVVDVAYWDDDLERKSMRSAVFYIRLGLSSTWLCMNFTLPLPDDLEEDYVDEEGELYEELDTETVDKLGLLVAQSVGFGALKNKKQRQDFVENFLTKPEHAEVPDYHAGTISARAESLYDFGVLPKKARKLTADGKSLSEVAKLLGISKLKAERALSVEIPEFIENMMKT